MTFISTAACDHYGCGRTMMTWDESDSPGRYWVALSQKEHRCPLHATLVDRVQERIWLAGQERGVACDVVTMVAEFLGEAMDDDMRQRLGLLTLDPPADSILGDTDE